MCGQAYALSRRDGGEQGPVRRLRQEPRADAATSCACTATRRTPIDRELRARASCWTRGVEDWDEAVALGEQHGYRNAQATVLAPTGTIGLLMDCDTTGIEPDFALVKFKKLAGGGYFKIVNQSVPARARAPRLRRAAQIERDRRATSVGTEHASTARRTSTARRCSAARASPSRDRPASRRRCPACSTCASRSRRGMLGDETLDAPRRERGASARSRLLPAAVPRLHRRADRRGERRASAAA